MELGALTAMTFGFRSAEYILDVLESITGLRMNHAFVRPGGLAQDLPGAPSRWSPMLWPTCASVCPTPPTCWWTTPSGLRGPNTSDTST